MSSLCEHCVLQWNDHGIGTDNLNRAEFTLSYVEINPTGTRASVKTVVHLCGQCADEVKGTERQGYVEGVTIALYKTIGPPLRR